MIRNIGADQYEVQIGRLEDGIYGTFNLQDLNTLLEEISELQEPIADLICDDTKLEAEYDRGYIEGVADEKNNEVDFTEAMCG